ncbi:hypothetical protein KKA14_18485 [bacterium]|nr:hypothetical protein [bacterium]
MINSIVRLMEDNLTLITSEPEEIGVTTDFEIKLPKDVILDSLSLRGKVTKRARLSNDQGAYYLMEISVLDLTETNRLILLAYIKYLEREKQLDDLFTHFNLKSVMENVLKCRDEFIEYKALEEFINAKIKDVTFQ